MHRCGTSVLTRGLQSAGLYLGEHLMPAAPENPKGFWEDTSVVAINEALLGSLGSDEQSLRWFSENDWDTPTGRRLHGQAREIVNERLSHTGSWAFKDPRTARLLPFWQNVFRELGVDERYVIALRNPLDAAQSYCYRNNKDPRRLPIDMLWGSLLWIEHMLAAAYWVRKLPAVVVDYNNLMLDPQHEIRRVIRVLDLRLDNGGNAKISDFADNFVDRKLHHFFSDAPALESHPDILPVVKQTYAILRAAASKDEVFSYEQHAEFWASTRSAFDCLAPALVGLTKDMDAIRRTWRYRARNWFKLQRLS